MSMAVLFWSCLWKLLYACAIHMWAFLSMCTCAYQSIFPWLERPFFQSCQKTKIGSGFWELLEMLWLGVAVDRISSLLMDGWNMNTSPDVLQWWSPSPAVASGTFYFGLAAVAANLLSESVHTFILSCTDKLEVVLPNCWGCSYIRMGKMCSKRG